MNTFISLVKSGIPQMMRSGPDHMKHMIRPPKMVEISWFHEVQYPKWTHLGPKMGGFWTPPDGVWKRGFNGRPYISIICLYGRVPILSVFHVIPIITEGGKTSQKGVQKGDPLRSSRGSTPTGWSTPGPRVWPPPEPPRSPPFHYMGWNTHGEWWWISKGEYQWISHSMWCGWLGMWWTWDGVEKGVKKGSKKGPKMGPKRVPTRISHILIHHLHVVTCHIPRGDVKEIIR